MDFQEVKLSDLSALTHTVSISDAVATGIPEFLVIRYSGVYHVGCKGAPDAGYIMATAEASRIAWHSRSLILDFTDLEYTWGDNIEAVFAIGQNRLSQCRYPLAVVVGIGCKEALISLLAERYELYCRNDLRAACELARAKRLEYEQCLKTVDEPFNENVLARIFGGLM